MSGKMGGRGIRSGIHETGIKVKEIRQFCNFALDFMTSKKAYVTVTLVLSSDPFKIHYSQTMR